ncbi:hypothetical protein PV325_007521 [Microctonus aethiopoides]|nr:hypothetical protein PV325_007521 [Microctonus aethiopoides]
MALFTKSEGFRRVPWFSLTEWHQAYKNIYSNNTAEQTEGYKTLLIWKTRMPKLPVGVECTLSLIQVCLRDREWVPKINSGEMPMYYENDLCLMYSTTIMRFLNQISNIGHTKQTSLFQIAKQLRIPEWIVNLRHDAAHSHELPAIGLLRMAANMLLTWLHDEYWAAEGQAFEEQFTKESEINETEDVESQTLIDLVELWMAIGLYIEAGYTSVSDLPDNHLQDTLNELMIQVKKLQDVSSDLCSKISTFLSRKNITFDKKQILINFLINSVVFLPTSESSKLFTQYSNFVDDCTADAQLPLSMIKFWQDFIHMLHEKKMLELLTLKLLEFINSLNEDNHRRLHAALWINSIAQGLIKLKIGQRNAQTLEHSYDEKNKRMTPKLMKRKLREKIHNENPELDNALCFNVTEDIPAMFMDVNFVRDIAFNPNDLTIKFLGPLLDLITPRMEMKNKQSLLQLVRIYTMNNIINNDNKAKDDTIHTINDVVDIGNGQLSKDNCHENEEQDQMVELADTKIRNNSWELPSSNYDWNICAFGVLPWQIDSIELLHSTDISPRLRCPDAITNIVPGYVDSKHLSSSSKVNWEKVLRKKQRTKRKKQKGDGDVMMNRAMEIVKRKKM